MSRRRKFDGSPDEMPALQRLREAAGLTQADLARQIPDRTRKRTLTRQVISGWERGEYEPNLTIVQIKALCRALNLVLDELPNDFGPPNQYSWCKRSKQKALDDKPPDLEKRGERIIPETVHI